MLKQLALQALDWVLPPGCLHCDCDLASGQGGGFANRALKNCSPTRVFSAIAAQHVWMRCLPTQT